MNAYERSVHFAFTMHLAELAMFPENEAFEIAKYDQAVDDNPATSPLIVMNPSGYDQRARFHFVDSERLDTLRADSRRCGPPQGTAADFRRVGVFLHALEDVYSHKGYGPAVGHLLAGHSPDKPWFNPAGLVDMASAKFQNLQIIRLRCGGVSAPRSAFEKTEAVLEQWKSGEYGEGTLDQGDSERWSALEKRLYGPRYSAYTVTWTRRYEEWKAGQDRNSWRRP